MPILTTSIKVVNRDQLIDFQLLAADLVTVQGHIQFNKDQLNIIDLAGDYISIRETEDNDYSFLWNRVVEMVDLDTTSHVPATKAAVLTKLQEYSKKTVNTTPGSGSVQDVFVTNTTAARVPISASDSIGVNTDAAASSDTGTFSLISLFKRWLSRFTDLVSGTISILVRGKIYVSTAPTLTLPAAGASYVAGDVLNATVAINLVFSNVIDVAEGEGYIVGVDVLLGDQTAAPTNVPGVLYLFNTDVTAIADDAPFASNLAASDSFQCAVGTSGFKRYAGTASFSLNNSARAPFKCAAASTTLYGQFTVDAAYVRAATTHDLIVKIYIAKA